MEYKFSSSEIEYTSSADGIIEFRHEGVLFRSVGQPTFDNSPSNNFSTYSSPLVCPDDVDFPDDAVGKIEWDIVNPDAEDESDACDWDKFDVYFNY